MPAENVAAVDGLRRREPTRRDTSSGRTRRRSRRNSRRSTANSGISRARHRAYWKQHAGPMDRLYLLLTTDHGMSNVAEDANIEKMLGLPHGQKEIALETAGGIGNVFLDQVPAGTGTRCADGGVPGEAEGVIRLRGPTGARTCRPRGTTQTRPAPGTSSWSCRAGTRSTARRPQPAMASSEVSGSPKGMHGYPVEDDPEMYGVMFLARLSAEFRRQGSGRGELGPISPDRGEAAWDQARRWREGQADDVAGRVAAQAASSQGRAGSPSQS